MMKIDDSQPSDELLEQAFAMAFRAVQRSYPILDAKQIAQDALTSSWLEYREAENDSFVRRRFVAAVCLRAMSRAINALKEVSRRKEKVSLSTDEGQAFVEKKFMTYEIEDERLENARELLAELSFEERTYALETYQTGRAQLANEMSRANYNLQRRRILDRLRRRALEMDAPAALRVCSQIPDS